MAFQSAQALTGNELRRYTGGGHFERGVSHGYIEGVFDARQGAFCPPPGITKGQAVDIVVNYLNGHPEILHHRADQIVVRAFRAVWPCE